MATKLWTPVEIVEFLSAATWKAISPEVGSDVPVKDVSFVYGGGRLNLTLANGQIFAVQVSEKEQ